jgi:hypothetical protein
MLLLDRERLLTIADPYDEGPQGEDRVSVADFQLEIMTIVL